MPASWIKTPVRDITIRITKGTTPTTGGGSFAESGVAFIKVESISEAGNILPEKLAYIDEATHQVLSRSIIAKDDVLFTIAGTIGRTALIREEHLPANTNQAVAIVRPDQQKVLPSFLYYALSDRNKTRQAESRTVQSVQANFSLGELGALEVELPSFSEQQEIASILGALDDKIEINRRMNGTLEALAQAVFKEWFVEKAEEGWEEKTIGDLAEVVGGATPSTKHEAFWAAQGHAWATPKDLSSLQTPVLLDTERHLTDEGLAEIGSGLLPTGTVLMSSRAPIGYIAIAEVPTAVNQGFIALKAKPEVSNLFLWQWTKQNMDEIKSRANGSTFQEISKASFRPIAVAVPPPHKMEAYDTLVRPMYERLVANERETRTLTALRDTLLPKLMRGEVRVEKPAMTKQTNTIEP